jgi:hypothetical protein
MFGFEERYDIASENKKADQPNGMEWRIDLASGPDF